MKIAFFDDRYYEVYGAQENVLLLAYLIGEKEEYETTFFTTWPGKLENSSKDRRINTQIVEAPANLRVFEKVAIRGGPVKLLQTALSALRYSFKFNRKLNEDKYDVVVVSSIRASLLLFVSRMFRRQKFILFAQNSTPFGSLAALALPGVDKLGIISSGSRTTFPSWIIKLYEKRIRNLASGRDLAKYNYVDRRNRDGHVSIVTVCSITERKGIHILISAVSQVAKSYSNVKLVVIGGTSGDKSEEYLAHLKRQAHESGIEVSFLGWVDNVVEYLYEADIFALTSENEGLPGVIIEAMATGLPVVTTDAGGCSDAVQENINGYVVPIGSVDDIADRITRLLDQDQRNLFGIAGRKVALKEYSEQSFADRFVKILNEFD